MNQILVSWLLNFCSAVGWARPRHTRTNSHCSGRPRLTVSQAQLAAAPWFGRVMQPGFNQRTPEGSISSRGT